MLSQVDLAFRCVCSKSPHMDVQRRTNWDKFSAWSLFIFCLLLAAAVSYAFVDGIFGRIVSAEMMTEKPLILTVVFSGLLFGFLLWLYSVELKKFWRNRSSSS